MSKEFLKNNWRKLDNVAKVFSLSYKNNMSIFRYSIILKNKIDQKELKNALKKTLNQYEAFKVKFGTGLFWNYLELNVKESIIQEEKGILCDYIDLKKNNDYLFKVSYYKNKINIDFLHVLTDGRGAMEFLKAFVCNYLSLKYNILFNEGKRNYNLSYDDQYLKNYNRNLKKPKTFKTSYQIAGKINKKINNTYHYILNLNEVKEVCKKYNVTITEYLTAKYIYAMHLSIHNKKTKKEIIIDIPINLRNYYNVDTLSNFFVCMRVNSKILEKNLTTFSEILNQVHNEFKENLSEENIKSYLTRDVKLGKNIPIRLIPLFIKKIVINNLITLVSKGSTSSVSNVGIIDLDDRFKKYISNIFVLVMPGRVQKIKCTICSFEEKLNVTLNSNINDIRFQQTFYNLLKKELDKIQIESNNIELI